MQTGEGSVTGRAKASRRETLTGSSPVCMIRSKTKAGRQGWAGAVYSGAVNRRGKSVNWGSTQPLNPVGYRQVAQRNRGRLDNRGCRLSMYENLV